MENLQKENSENEMLRRTFDAQRDEIHQLKKFIEQLKAIPKGENSVSEVRMYPLVTV